MSILALVNPASNAHAPYYIIMCGLSGYTIIFAHNLITGFVRNMSIQVMKSSIHGGMPANNRFQLQCAALSELLTDPHIQSPILHFINIYKTTQKVPFPIFLPRYPTLYKSFSEFLNYCTLGVSCNFLQRYLSIYSQLLVSPTLPLRTM